MKEKYFKCIAISFFAASSVPSLADSFREGDLWYEIDKNNSSNVIVTKAPSGYSYTETSYDIPESITHEGIVYKVIGLGESTFYLCNNLTSVSLPNSLLSIGRAAFRSCEKLKEISIPESVNTIGSQAFYSCSSLSSLTIPESVSSIGDNIIYDCNNMSVIIVEEGNSSYDSREGCNAIIKTDKNLLVAGCKSTVIPSSVSGIGNSAFSNCDGLLSITIPESVVSIGESAFFLCNNLTSVSLPNSLQSIGRAAFRSCEKLKGISIPESVNTIGSQAFYGCSSLSSLTIPASVSSIGDNIIDDCDNMSVIIVEEGNSSYDSREGCNAIIKTDKNLLVAGCKSTVIPSSVSGIGNSAFSNCDGLLSITIPESVVSIGESAFFLCNNLTSVSLPNSLQSIGRAAFRSCEKLKEISIPESVNTIGSLAFYNCATLIIVTSFIISPKGINEDVFENISEKATLYIPTGTSSAYQQYEGWTKNFKNIIEFDPYRFEADGIYYKVDDASPDIACVTSGDVKYSGSMIIPSSVTYKGKAMSVTAIGEKAFYECKELISVSLPSTISKIGNEAFSNCSELVNVELPNSLKEIGECAFSRCSKLSTIHLPSLLEKIGINAFEYCSTLSEIIIPKSVSSIAENNGTPFKGCKMLSTLEVEEGNNVYESPNNCNAIIKGDILIAGCLTTEIPFGITTIGADAFNELDIASIDIPNTVTVIGSSAFKSTKLSSIKLPASLKEVGFWSFSYCSRLAKIELPSSLKEIGRRAFENCPELSAIQLPASLEKIGSSAFGNCSSLIEVTSFIIQPFSIEESVFSGIADNATLFVPKGTSSAYQQSEGWGKNFKNIEEYDPYKFEVDGIYYRIDENKLSEVTVVAGDDKYKGAITIPESVLYNSKSYRVTSIGENAFSLCFELLSVSMPNSISVIGEKAFNQSSNIKNITLSNSLSVIGEEAFYYCRSLETISLPNTLVSIGEKAFHGCQQLSGIFIPENVQSIGYSAFGDCDALASIIVDEKNKIYCSTDNCNAIIHSDTIIVGCKNTTIPESVIYIGKAAFFGHSGLNDIVLPDGLKGIGTYAFCYCDQLKDVESHIQNPFTIPNNVFSHIHEEAVLFVPEGKVEIYKQNGWDSYFKSVEEIAPKPVVTNAGMNFEIDVKKRVATLISINDGLEYVVIPESVIYSVPLPPIVFSNGSDDEHPDITLIEGSKENEYKERSNVVIVGEEIAYPVTEIAESAFSNSNIISLSIPNSIQRINKNIINGCLNLAAIEWNLMVPPTSELQSHIVNPNLLFYINDLKAFPDNIRNVVVDGSADEITLTDEEYGDFYCPKAFVAKKISYTHKYSLETQKGVCEGWESIALPFDVQTYITPKGEAKPYKIANTGERLFWLRELTSSGMLEAEGIKANTPYIISMPNWEGYQDYYNIYGEVEFSAQDVTIDVTDIKAVDAAPRHFWPCYQKIKRFSNCFALNKQHLIPSDTYHGEEHLPGSVFLGNLRDINPFEAYFTYDGASASRAIKVSELISSPTSISNIEVEKDISISGTIIKNVSHNDSTLNIYSATGQLVKRFVLSQNGNVMSGLKSGIYIINGAKVIVK